MKLLRTTLCVCEMIRVNVNEKEGYRMEFGVFGSVGAGWTFSLRIQKLATRLIGSFSAAIIIVSGKGGN
jgi:hypothetical protein